jgi:gamma-glutamyltranspeptidase
MSDFYSAQAHHPIIGKKRKARKKSKETTHYSIIDAQEMQSQNHYSK